jgi:hypothetical protein
VRRLDAGNEADRPAIAVVRDEQMVAGLGEESPRRGGVGRPVEEVPGGGNGRLVPEAERGCPRARR